MSDNIMKINDPSIRQALDEFEDMASGRMRRLDELSGDVRVIEKTLAAYPVPPFATTGIGFHEGQNLQLGWGKDKEIWFSLSAPDGKTGRGGRLLGAPSMVRLFVIEHGLLIPLIHQAKQEAEAAMLRNKAGGDVDM